MILELDVDDNRDDLDNFADILGHIFVLLYTNYYSSAMRAVVTSSSSDVTWLCLAEL